VRFDPPPRQDDDLPRVGGPVARGCTRIAYPKLRANVTDVFRVRNFTLKGNNVYKRTIVVLRTCESTGRISVLLFYVDTSRLAGTRTG